MLKRMKKQLTEAADYHHQCVTELDKREKFEVSGNIATSPFRRKPECIKSA